MKIVGFTAEVKEFKGQFANVGVHRTEFTSDSFLIGLAFEAI